MWNIFSFLSSFLQRIGLWQKKGTLLIIGLDNAGKSTLLRKLVDGDIHALPPTAHFNKQEVSLHGLKLCAYDVGGHVQMRRMWKDYLYFTDAVVFIVDSSDESRLPEACAELHEVMNIDDMDKRIPIAVLCNKIDKPEVRSPEYLIEQLNLSTYLTGKGEVSREMLGDRRPVEVFMCSTLRQVGYGEAFKWIAQYF